MNDKIKAIVVRHNVVTNLLTVSSENGVAAHQDRGTLIKEYRLLEGRFELLNEQYKDRDEDLTFEYDMRVKLEKEMESKS